MVFLPVLVLLAFIIFYAILSADAPGLLKFVLVFVEMIILTNILVRKYGFHSEMGCVLLKSKKGLLLIERLSGMEKLWNMFADIGSFMSYGLLTFFLMKKKSLKAAVAGFFLLFVMMFLVAPFILPFLAYIIGFPIGAVSDSGTTAQAESTSAEPPFSIANLIPMFFLISLIVGGAFLLLFFGLILQALIISQQTVDYVSGISAVQPNAGATFIIPGINLPFFEGIVALVVILMVHEGAHAILARIGKIRVLSTGLVLFGIIPVGAFVEPDEKGLKHLDRVRQSRVIVAGSTANFFTCILAFILLIGFIYFTQPFKESGLLVVAGMNESFILKSVNGMDFTGDLSKYSKNGMELPKNSTVHFITNKGEMDVQTDANGKLGIMFIPLNNSFFLVAYSNVALQFIYVTLGLIFVLNFAIGTMNMLPLPFFDGYRLLSINIKNKRIVFGLMVLTLLAFLLNLLPNLFMK
ncbi:MAG: site-2 protease family protein [Candidatus Micrarchaeota archaeon]